MPRRNSLISRLRYGRAWDEWDEEAGDDADAPPLGAATGKTRSRRRRAFVALTFATLFVAGAAFSAAAGDQVRSVLEQSAVSGDQTPSDATTTDTTAPASTDPAPAAGPATDGGALAPAGSGSSGPTPAPSEATAPSGSTAPTEAPAPSTAPAAGAPAASVAAKAVVQQAATRSGSVAKASGSSKPAAHRAFVVTSRAHVHRHHFPKPKPVLKAPAPDLEGAASAVVWLNRALPDPTPPALRLKARFARHLQSVARAKHVNWALMLGVLRAEGHDGAAPANLGGLRVVAARIARGGVQSAGPWAAMFSLSTSTTFADRAVALSHYYRAVGLQALVNGLEAEKAKLGNKVLNDSRVTVYSGGRGDIASGRVDVRVLASIEYLADSFGQVTVSCLISGHRLYARPGVISAHIYGLAADISEVGGTAIEGHQQPGGVTEHAVRDLLMLPPELLPKQVISLLGLGGPSFALADHYNHIHIGY